jgi:catechol 2,3-dioxygenase-like lactoylglutathione lyase family enzyme
MKTSAVTIAGYSHVAIAVKDADAARAFYGGLLGFEELPRPDFGVPGLWMRVGDLQLHFIETDEVLGPGKGFTHFALHVPAESFHQTVEALQASGVPFLGPPSKRVDFGTDVWAAFITDPSGNVIELTDVGPLPAS